MTYVQSFSRVTPPPRYDEIAWPQIEIWESATKTGTYTLIDTQAIPVDPTPEDPDTLAITTVLATLAVGWYMVRARDGSTYSAFTRPRLAPAGSILGPGDDADDPSQELERIAVGRAGRITVVFCDVDEVPTEPDDTPVVTVLDADGNLLLEDEPATVDPDEPTRFTAVMPAIAVPALTQLTAVWTASVDGDDQRAVTTVEVCANHLFTLARLRALLNDVLTADQQADRQFTLHELRQARLDAERELEAACHQAFTGRYARELARVDRFARVNLTFPHITRVRAVAIDDGDPLDTDELQTVTAGPGTGLLQTTGWTADSVVTVDYEHGRPVAGAEQAALILAKERLLRGPISDRATQRVAPGELGGTIRLLTPGQRGVVTGIPVVDEFIGRYAYPGIRLA